VKLTRERQIERALEILAPPPDKREICRRNIEFMLEDVEAFRGNTAKLKLTRSKARTRAWNRYRQTAKRLRADHDALAATGFVPPIKFDDREIQDLERHHRNWLAFIGKEEARVVEWARELLRQWHPHERPTTTNGGRWWGLSWVLLGENRDLHRYLIACAREPFSPFID
jgi:hypothetical protein